MIHSEAYFNGVVGVMIIMREGKSEISILDEDAKFIDTPSPPILTLHSPPSEAPLRPFSLLLVQFFVVFFFFFLLIRPLSPSTQKVAVQA